jgi:tetratricopeptide (TPR) repeat protein
VTPGPYPPPNNTHCYPDPYQVCDLNPRCTHYLTFKSSILGESPPLPSRTFFGRDEMIEKIVDLAENLTPVALIGPGGIGKTSIALAVLHHDRIKERFGDNRRFIRCDQFPTSRPHLLRRLSNVIGAGIKNPDDLVPLRRFLSSKKTLIVLDNAESILDPQGTDAQEIYAVVDELSRFSNICICITSRISTIPPDFNHIDVPTLSIDAARDTFYRIYGGNDRSDLINTILEQLDFHPLSITLLATVARQNRWDMNRLAREWDGQRTSVLRTEHNTSLAATIELSLASPLFQELGPDARAVLGVVAFFPQGVEENNINWLFPTIPNRHNIFDKFCILSLTYRSNGFVTMLAPLRDHLCPKDPMSSSLLCAIKAHYFTRMEVSLNPNGPDFVKTQWITLEDVNVEHLLNVFITIDPSSDNVWGACASFMRHLVWHKNRLVILKPKIEGLPDNHSSKPECLFELSRLFQSVGNEVERKQLLTCALTLERERGSGHQVARILRHLANVNGATGLPEEGIQLAKEALEIGEQLGDPVVRARCLTELAFSLRTGRQFDAAEETASRAITLFPEKGEEYRLCRSHRILGGIYQFKGERDKAIHHFEVALGITSSFDWHDEPFWVHYRLGDLFSSEGRFDDAHAHIEHAKSHTTNNALNLGYATEMQAWVWYKQDRLEEARSEALRAADIYEKFGVAKDMEDCSKLLQCIRRDTMVVSGQSDFDCELL